MAPATAVHADVGAHASGAHSPRARCVHEKHTLEVADPKHRYGKHLAHYRSLWAASGCPGDFFQWLDCGAGAGVSLPHLPRAQLESCRVVYLSPAEREAYRVSVRGGRLVLHRTGAPFGSAESSTKAIFVMSPSGELYAGLKEVGRFHHSSFLCGGAVKFAGTWSVRQGVLLEIGPHSGHYRPTAADLLGFLESLDAAGLDLAQARLSVKETCVKKEVVVGGLSFTGVHGNTAAALLARWRRLTRGRRESEADAVVPEPDEWSLSVPADDEPAYAV